jgi:hypothetical protein
MPFRTDRTSFAGQWRPLLRDRFCLRVDLTPDIQGEL